MYFIAKLATKATNRVICTAMVQIIQILFRFLAVPMGVKIHEEIFKRFGKDLALL